MQFPQHHRALGDGALLQSFSQDGQNRNIEQQVMNPVHQAYSLYTSPASEPAKPEVLAHVSSKDQEMWLGSRNMQDFAPPKASSSKNSSENFPCEKQQGLVYQQVPDQRHEMQSAAHPSQMGQLASPNVVRPPVHGAQMQVVQSWAAENNIDLSLPANSSMMAQFLRLATSPSVVSENSSYVNSPCEASGQLSYVKTGQSVPGSGPPITTIGLEVVSHGNNNMVQQFPSRGRETQVASGKAFAIGNGMLPIGPQAAGAPSGVDRNLQAKKPTSIQETVQVQHLRLLNQSSPHPSVSSAGGGLNNNVSSQVGANVLIPQQQYGFTKQQLHVLKAQILALRRLKKKETLPQELLRAIVPPPLDYQLHQQLLPVGGSGQAKSDKLVEDTKPALVTAEVGSIQLVTVQNISKDRATVAEGKTSASAVQMQDAYPVMKDTPVQFSSREDHMGSVSLLNVEQDCEQTHVRADIVAEKGKGIATQGTASEAMQGKKSAQPSAGGQQKESVSAQKYHGPLFDFPYFTRKHDSIVSTPLLNANSNPALAYDLKDLLFEESMEVLNKKRTENLKKINGLLAVNLERKRIRPDLVLRLQIEEKKLKLIDLQARLREEVDRQQQEIMAMPDRPYRKFVRLCERQRIELNRQVYASQRALRERQLKSVFQWRKKLLEAHWAIRDARTARNRGVAKYHERVLREFSKRTDDRDRRMEALKNNDVERYREMLLEQQTVVPGAAAERYTVLSSFLTQTEEYLQKLGGKITAAKNQQEVDEAANAAAAAARLQGLSEEEVRAAAACACEEVMIRNRFIEMNAPKDSSSVRK